jgi:hypothetical protein
MMNKWHKIKADCELASADDSATITMPPTSYFFKREAKNTTAMLSVINTVAVLLQERLLPLHRYHTPPGNKLHTLFVKERTVYH